MGGEWSGDGGLGLQGGVTGRLARLISKAEGLRFYPQVVSSPRRQGRFRTEPHSPETSGGRGVSQALECQDDRRLCEAALT